MHSKVQFWYCFGWITIFSVHFWIYSVPNRKLASKLTILYFSRFVCPNYGPFCRFESSYDPLMPCKVHVWYCFVCTSIFSVHLRIYSVSNGKLASKLTILYFWPSFCPNSGSFWWLWELLRPTYALQSIFYVLFCLHNHLFSPCMELQHSKWKIGLKIDDFVLLTPFLNIIFAYIALINGNKLLIKLVEYMFCIHLFTKPLR